MQTVSISFQSVVIQMSTANCQLYDLEEREGYTHHQSRLNTASFPMTRICGRECRDPARTGSLDRCQSRGAAGIAGQHGQRKMAADEAKNNILAEAH